MTIIRIYGVITADVISSKKTQEFSNTEVLKNRAFKLNEELLNRGFEIRSGISVSRGDELQIICGKVSEIPAILRLIRYMFLPNKLRIGVGIGTIDYYNYNFDYDIIEYNKTSWDLNGKAFFSARKAIDAAKTIKGEVTRFSVEFNNINKFMEYEINYKVNEINVIFNLIDFIIFKWTERQWQYIYNYDKYGKLEGASTALGVSNQAVSKTINASGWKNILIAENHLNKILEDLEKMIN